MRLGYSVSAHYRLINSIEDVFEIVRGITTLDGAIESVELSYYDEVSMDMYSEGYRRSKNILLLGDSKDISIHYLRKGVTEDNFEQISTHIKDVAQELGVKEITVHHDMFLLLKSHFTKHFQDFNLLIENDDWRGIYKKTYRQNEWADEYVRAITLDVCHFDFNNTDTLEDFLRTHFKKIQEVQFAYLNHNLPELTDIFWLRERFRLMEKYLDVSNLRLRHHSKIT